MTATASQSVRLGPGDLFDLKFLRDARLSPDGRHLSYAVSHTEGDQEWIEIWICNADGQELRRLPYRGTATSPRWSPDGRWIAFVGDSRLRVAEVESLSVSEPLTPEHLSLQGAPSWAPDSKRIAASLLKRMESSTPRHITGNHFRAEGIGFIEGLAQSIYEIDRTKRSLRCLTPAEGFCSQPEWSPCGTRILFLSSREAIPYASYSPRLLTVGVEDGEVAEVLGEGWYITTARWLPDGGRIAAVAAYNSQLTVPTPSLWVVDRSGRDPQLRTPDLVGYVGFNIHHDMPAWDLTTGSTLAIADRRIAFATVHRHGSAEVWRIALEGEIVVQRILTGDRSCLVMDVRPESNIMLFAATDLTCPPELYCCSLDEHREVRLTQFNDAVLEQWPRVTVKRLAVRSADALPIDAWFMAPESQSKPLPTVLFIHGGPFSATGYAFRYDLLLLASQGFGVLFANFRGSVGYGESFTRAIMGDWGGRGYPDHMATVDAAIEQGLADPDRLGVWGPSHGGFATCWIVGHTRRFKAAIAEAPSTNWSTLYYMTDAPEVFARDMGGRPHEIPDVYRKLSPITYAHFCETPTLLVHGENDLRCPIGESEQFHRVLRDIGCKTEFIRIPDCNHTGDSCGPLSARRAQNEALVSWFVENLC